MRTSTSTLSAAQATILIGFGLAKAVGATTKVDVMSTGAAAAATVLAKSVAILSLVHGSAQISIRTKILTVYGAPIGKMNVHLFRTKGVVLTSMAVTAICSLFFSPDIVYPTAAVGYAQIPWIVGAARNIFTANHKKSGYSISNDLVPLFVGPMISYACLACSADLADNVAKYFGYFILLQGTTLTSTPALHSQLWGSEFKRQVAEEPILRTSLPALGLQMLSLGTFIVATTDFGQNGTKAFGYAFIWPVLMTLLPLASNGLVGLNGPLTMWLIVGVAVVSSAIFSAA